LSDNGLITLNTEALNVEVPPRPSYAARIQRARELAEHSSASELLSFYSRLAFLQQQIFESLGGTSTRIEQNHATSWPLLIDRLAPLFPKFVRSLAEICPSPMRERARNFAQADEPKQTSLLTRFWNGSPEESEDDLLDRSVALAFLQPYAEWLAQFRSVTSITHRATCPICSSEPVCAVLRDQYHGARRGLICSLCMNEWSFPRLRCPGCGEERFEALPVFTPEAMPHVRIDACETCKLYIKTIDLTKDGLAVAVVDELATASLDIWARSHGYSKVVRNIAAL
jgi:formate dehydrogenase accessory protein FdhE